MAETNPYDLGDVAARMRRLVSGRASLAGPLRNEVIGLRQELAQCKAQHDELLALLERTAKLIVELDNFHPADMPDDIDDLIINLADTITRVKEPS